MIDLQHSQVAPASGNLPAFRLGPEDYLTFWDFFQTFIAVKRIRIRLTAKHKLVCDEIELACLGVTVERFIIINIPPRFGKTMIMRAATLWQLAYFPESHIIFTSYSDDLACRSVRFIRDTTQEGWYRDLFPWTVLGNVQRADEFHLAYGGAVYGEGTHGSLTGKGFGTQEECGGFGVVDDPSKPDEALSQVESQTVRDWLEETFVNRANSPHAKIFVIMQRLAPDDLSGHIMTNYPGDFRVVKVAAVAGESSTIPEIRSTKDLLRLRELRPDVFYAQYQQEPIILGGNLIKVGSFGRHHEHSASIRWDQKILVVDSAQSSKSSADYAVCQCWGKANGRAYLLDSVRGKWDAPELLANVATMYQKHHTFDHPLRNLLVEEKASGPGLIQGLKMIGIPTKPINPVKDKVSRVEDVLNFIVCGLIFVPREQDAPWLGEFLSECAAFRKDGNAAHDDQVDCLSMALSHLFGHGVKWYEAMGMADKANGRPAA